MIRPFAFVSRLLAASVASLTALVVVASQASALVPPPDPVGSGGSIHVPAGTVASTSGLQLQWVLVVGLAIAAITLGAGLMFTAQRVRTSRPWIA